MADDDKGGTSGTPLSAEHAASPQAAKEPGSEWTASDRRGPLTSAEDEGAERYVPAHETDAEGALDPQSPAQHEPVRHEAPAATSDAMGVSSSDAAGHAPPSDPIAPQPTQRAALPIVLGLVAGVVGGVGGAWLIHAALSGTDDQALSSRVDALEKRPSEQGAVAKLGNDVEDLRGKVAALQKQVATPPSTGGAGGGQASKQESAPANAALEGRVGALQAALDVLKARTAALQAGKDEDKGSADQVAALQSGLADARKEAAGSRASLDSLKTEQAETGRKVAGLTIAVAGALKKAETAQTGVESVQGQQKALEGKLGSPALAVVADSLVQQIAAGQPFARQVDALASLGADPAKVAVLRQDATKGVPSAAVLLGKWKPLEDTVIAVGNKAPANANLGQRLQHGLLGLVSVRRADETAGSDLGSRVNRIASDLAHDDVPGAFAGWQALPSDAKARSDAWGALAKTSAAALAAARDLQRSAIEALGTKKS